MYINISIDALLNLAACASGLLCHIVQKSWSRVWEWRETHRTRLVRPVCYCRIPRQQSIRGNHS